ncbi:MFS transporter [Actinophytocola sediminis]
MTAIDQPPRAGRREWGGLAVLSLATLMITFDMFVLLLALPDLSADLRPTSTQQLWILDIYGFLVGGFLITMGTLGDRIGRRKLLMIGAASFLVASLISAYAPTAELLILARALLGIAGATLAPSTLALLSNMFRDPKQMGMAVGVWAGSFTLGSILGPVVGGFMLAHFWWGSVFLIAVPIMGILLVLAPMLVPESKDPDAGKLDLTSAVMSLVAMLSLIYGIKETARNGFEAVPVLVAVIGLVVGVMFVRRQRALTQPMLDLNLFGNRSFSTMLVGLILYGLVGASSMMFITQHFQSVSELSPLEAALCLLPGMVVATISATVAPILAQRIRPAYLIGYSLFGVVAAFIWFTQVEATSGPVMLIVGFTIIGLCDGPLVSLGTNLVIGSAPPEKAGSSASMAQIANEAGGALGLALLGSVGTAIYASQMNDNIPDGVPAESAAAATENVATAVAEAESLPAGIGDTLASVARDAFSTGMSIFATVSAIVVGIAAIFIITQLKHVPPTGKEEENAESSGETEDVATAPSA